MRQKYLDNLIKKSSTKKVVRSKKPEPTKRSAGVFSFKTFMFMKSEREESNISIFVWSVIYAICFLTTFYLLISTKNGIYFRYLQLTFIILSVLCLFRIFFYSLQAIFQFPFYKTGFKRLPFSVSGWSSVFNYEDFYNHEMWIKTCTLTISCKPSSEYYQKALHASLLLFCNNAGRNFSKYHNGILTAWTITGESISGSCNCKIIGKLYRYITRDLRKIQKNTGMIAGINIHVDKIVVNAAQIETFNSAAST